MENTSLPSAAATPAPFIPRDSQRRFLESLASTGRVRTAAKAAGLSRDAFYRARNRPGGEAFAAAWDSALHVAIRRVADLAMEQAIEGEVTPIYYKGEQIGERVRHNPRLLMWLLARRDPLRYGRTADEVPELSRHRLEAAEKRLAQAIDIIDPTGDDSVTGDTTPC